MLRRAIVLWPQVPDAAETPDMLWREVCELSADAQGLTYAEIARTLVISGKTVSSHVSNLLRKTGTASRVELTRLVRRSGD